MRYIFIHIYIINIVFFSCSMAQGNWAQKSDFAGTARSGSAGFSAGKKVYVGTGADNVTIGLARDLWEFCPMENVWSQKADLPTGLGRRHTVGFSVSDYGYLGTGLSSDNLSDLWRYDPSTNTWEKKADFGGGGRAYAVGISIGDKGYIGTGSSSTNALKKDWWEYDPSSDTWTQKSNLPASARLQAVAFSIGDKGYLGLGTLKQLPTHPQDFWEFDPATNTWTQIANFAGTIWSSAVAFSIGSKGYVGTGVDTFGVVTSQFWEYDPATDTWTKMPDFPGAPRRWATGFAIGGSGYIGTGTNDVTDSLYSDFWQFTPGCAVPTGQIATNITQSKAILLWNAVNGVVGYKLRYKVKNTSTWTVLSSGDTSKKISGLSAGVAYTWQVKTICSSAPVVSSEWSAKEEFTTALRLGGDDEYLSLLCVSPNPVNTEAMISFFVSEKNIVTLELFDVSGNKMQTLLSKDLEAGSQEVPINSNQLSSGIYLLKLTEGDETEVVKIIIE